MTVITDRIAELRMPQVDVSTGHSNGHHNVASHEIVFTESKPKTVSSPNGSSGEGSRNGRIPVGLLNDVFSVRKGNELFRTHVSLRSTKMLLDIQDDLPDDAVKMSDLMKHGSALEVLGVFGTPQSVGESDKIHKVEFAKVGEFGNSMITAYDGSDTLVISRAGSTQIINNAIIRESETKEGQSPVREIIPPLHRVTTLHKDGSTEVRQTARVFTIVDNAINIRTIDADSALDQPLSPDAKIVGFAEKSGLQTFTVNEGEESARQGVHVRTVINGDEYKEYDKNGRPINLAEIRAIIDDAVLQANRVVFEPWGNGVSKPHEIPEHEPIEGITPGVRVPVKDVLENMSPYKKLFDIMKTKEDPLPFDVHSDIFRFPFGSYATNIKRNPDDIYLTPGSREIGGWTQVAFQITEDVETGRKNAYLSILGEEINLANAQMEVTTIKGDNTVPLGIRFIIPGEKNTARIVDIHTYYMSMENSSYYFINKPVSSISDVKVIEDSE